MKTTLMAIALLISSPISANEHALGAHEHGAIKLGMAVEKNMVDIDLDGPAESFIGFEYLPKTKKEKKTFAAAENQWKKHLLTLISFEKKLNCKITEASFNQIIDEKTGAHSDIEAKAKITCASNIVGSIVEVAIKKHFPNIKKLTVEVISGEIKSVEIKGLVQSFKI